MNFSTRQLKAFKELARAGNFTKAAEELHMTQAGLSLLIRQLESQVGCRLFNRTTRSVALTVEGEHFLPAACKALDTLENAVESLAELQLKAKRRLFVGVTPLVSSNIFPIANKLFNEAYPDVKINVIVTNHEHIQALVEAGDLDFGLGANFSPSPDIDSITLFKYDLMWIAPTDLANTLPDFKEGTLPWSALEGIPLFSLPTGNQIQKIINMQLDKIGRGNEERTIVNNFETMIAMVSVGEGTAILPSYSIDACRRFGVEAAILTEPKVSLDFYQITKKGRQSSALVDKFIDAFRRSVPRSLAWSK